ncbi:MAG: isoleucine--tRNA ligase [Bacteroidales bacterium]|nr:isoleucine--tRNA ligase [Bacteroidales bacterium]MBN2749420.1 isoleucine--tRNA ligase [Bacteroidales bacterium]
MKAKFKEYKGLDLSQVNKDVLKTWEQNDTFHKSLTTREGRPTFVFYEGPPSANGMPGIHHVMARTIKDIFCRYKTQQGYLVHRKAGWDTHGLPVELGVEKMLGITKEHIGKTISVEEYNNTCRKEVMKYTDVWEDLTHKMGYWVDMEHPYITYDNRYIESLWHLLQMLFDKGLLYKGKTIQPFSPAAGTGLSTHELNQPGCYRDVKDTTVVAQFRAVRNNKSEFLFADSSADVYFLAWTTTPWTLPSNTALALGPNIRYVKVLTFNPYSGDPAVVILAKDRLAAYFNAANENEGFEEYKPGDKKLPYRILAEYAGSELVGVSYEQLFPWIKPEGDAFRTISGDYVTTEDGTGIVHIAPTFGADDDRVAKAAGIAPLILRDKMGSPEPMVDRQGRFYRLEDIDETFVANHINVEVYGEFAGRFVKNAYDPNLTEEDTSLDVDLCVVLKKENKAFRIEKHVHSYPHCWRTDKPVLYYPLDSWFIRTTALKERMMQLNDTINWKPASTGTGRFGKWLENLVDWNLSRSRYWGTPLPVWVSEDRSEVLCIGSVAQLKDECEKSVKAGFMSSNPLATFTEGDFSDDNYNKFDLHRPFVDNIVLVSATGQKMVRETDLIDVWFDSGAMPYAQVHYPFQNKENFGEVYPADFIAEGVDQTRGWFFTLHAIATMLFDSVAFKNIISNGLVLDKNGNKMSKRLGNAVEPFEVIEQYGSDPLRWYMITNSQPWDNLKFDIDGVDEVRRKFFGTLYNTYSFFSLYANVDGFTYQEAEVPVAERPEIDRWIISLLNSVVKEVHDAYESYEPTRAGRAIQEFVMENLSNWYVRLNRKRFWGGEYDKDKIAAYQTLYTCLETVAMLSAPIAPFYSEQLYLDLTQISGRDKDGSVHLSTFPTFNAELIDKALEEQMDIAQRLSSMVLGLRRKVSIKVRQPLQKMMVPVLDENFRTRLKAVETLILNEVNVKELEYLTDTAGVLVKKIKPNFKELGPRYGKMMKSILAAVAQMTQQDIATIEREGKYSLNTAEGEVDLLVTDVDIISEDIPGWLVANEGKLTIALDVTVTSELRMEGIARELINRIQNLRKDAGFDVTDKINVTILKHEAINSAVMAHKDYIAGQTLAKEITLTEAMPCCSGTSVELDTDIVTAIKVVRV